MKKELDQLEQEIWAKFNLESKALESAFQAAHDRLRISTIDFIAQLRGFEQQAKEQDDSKKVSKPK